MFVLLAMLARKIAGHKTYVWFGDLGVNIMKSVSLNLRGILFVFQECPLKYYIYDHEFKTTMSPQNYIKTETLESVCAKNMALWFSFC